MFIAPRVSAFLPMHACSALEADRRAVEMGFGRELGTALRRVAAEERADDGATIRDNLLITHPSARSRVVRIEALRRREASRRRMLSE